MIDDFQSVAQEGVTRKSKARIFTPEEEQQIRDAFNYDPETGVFTWRSRKRRSGKSRVGGVAGGIQENGKGDKRWILGLNGKQLKAHRVAFLLMTGRQPQFEVDHADQNPLNNRWSNLREATRTENLRNRGMSSLNACGHKGVHYIRRPGLIKRYDARITFNGKCCSLGIYLTALEAHEAFVSAALFLHGEFVNIGQSPLLD